MNFLKLLKLHFLITWSDNRGAVVTHGGVLPDSSQKTDFYSIIDNATVSSITATDISASAGITDSQLNTISTAGKVNVSALTGQIANANLAQLVSAALVSGAALTLLPNIPSGAGIIPVANVGGLLGAWTSLSQGTTYLAATDGILIGISGAVSTGLNLKTDNTSSPTIIRAYGQASTGQYSSACCPVKKGDHYIETGSVGDTVFFISIGS